MRHLRTLGLCLVAAFALGLIGAASALAKPNEYQKFEECPLANPKVQENGCIFARSSSGSEFTAGNIKVPLLKPIDLNMGFHEKEVEPEVEEIIGAEYGNLTMTKVAQEVPGGLEAAVEPALLSPAELERYHKIVESGKTKVTATVELAGSPSAIYLDEAAFLSEENVEALGLPTQVKLSNPFLGNACYVGSTTNPIIVHTTAGTTSPPEGIEPIKGRRGEIKVNNEGTIIHFIGARLVDNTFPVPGVSNCGKSGGADAAIDAKSGLPSPAGHNTVALEGELSQAGAGPIDEHLTR
ncbi:MAG TPA: hypothetical protein VKG38_04290 [Solirubrobacteraceae bacterium]|nr:hypothetical protein [Solirubrobacteraceae bacterium]